MDLLRNQIQEGVKLRKVSFVETERDESQVEPGFSTPPKKKKWCSTEPMATAPISEQVAGFAEGMSLAGNQLQPPRILATGWREGQRFTADDDPDRTAQTWQPPSFLRSKDPIAQRAKTSVEDLDLPHLSKEAQTNCKSCARIVHGALDEEDCAELIAHMNQKGFTPALVNIGGGMQMLEPELRDGHRVVVDSPELTEWLFKVLQPYIPKTFGESQVIDLNERCRFLCYTPGQYFASHHDGRYVRQSGHPNAGDCSRVTVQLYLHDVPHEAGGATNFVSQDEQPVVRCQPVAGSVLLFTQDLYHEGELLSAGLKYTLRTEAMYRKPAKPSLSKSRGGS